VRGIILVHPNAFGRPAFDIFGPDELREELKEWGYRNEDCPYVKKYASKMPFDYICSEDLEHIGIINDEVQMTINVLLERGIAIKFVGWEDRPWDRLARPRGT